MVAGIDFSTKAVDVALLDDDTEQAGWERFEIADKRGSFYAARNVYEAFKAARLFEDNGVWLCGIERPYGHGRSQSSLMRVQGAILARIPVRITVVETPPQEWKRELLGKPNASKDEVRHVVYEIVGAEWPQDACDALGVAYAVRALNQRAIVRNGSPVQADAASEEVEDPA